MRAARCVGISRQHPPRSMHGAARELLRRNRRMSWACPVVDPVRSGVGAIVDRLA